MGRMGCPPWAAPSRIGVWWNVIQTVSIIVVGRNVKLKTAMALLVGLLAAAAAAASVLLLCHWVASGPVITDVSLALAFRPWWKFWYIALVEASIVFPLGVVSVLGSRDRKETVGSSAAFIILAALPFLRELVMPLATPRLVIRYLRTRETRASAQPRR